MLNKVCGGKGLCAGLLAEIRVMDTSQAHTVNNAGLGLRHYCGSSLLKTGITEVNHHTLVKGLELMASKLPAPGISLNFHYHFLFLSKLSSVLHRH